MTDENEILCDDARRSSIEKGALGMGALALGASDTAAAQGEASGDETETEATPNDTGGSGGEGIIQVGTFYPEARFTFVSGVVEWSPDAPAVRDDIWDNYNTYQIRWLNTNEIVLFWVERADNPGKYDPDLGFVPDGDDPDQPQLWEMEEEWGLFPEGNNLVEVTFSPVPEEQENQILENDEWWQDEQGGDGTATPAEIPTETPTETETENAGLFD